MITIACGSHIGSAQISNYNFEHLTTEDGMSSDKVEYILQDKEGFYWISTQNGLNRYDGTSFKIFRHHSEDSTSLMHDYCTVLAEGKNGDIWIATHKGLCRYIRNKGNFRSVYLYQPFLKDKQPNRISNIVVDQNGDVWISAYGLWKYDTRRDSLILFQSRSSDISSISDNSYISYMVYDSLHHGLWLTTLFNLNFYSMDQDQFYHAKYNPGQWKVFDHADAFELALDHKNQLWFRDKQTQQLSYFDITENQITLTPKKVIKGIKNICADQRDRIWICYWLGSAEIYDPVSKMADTSFFIHHHSHSILNENAGSLYIDHQNNYWITSFNGISIYNEANQYYRLLHLDADEKSANREPREIRALAQTEADYIWIATNQGLLKYDLKQDSWKPVPLKSASSQIQTLCADGHNLWIGEGRHLRCMDTKKEAMIRNIDLSSDAFFLRKGKLNDLWAGTWDNGLFHVDLASGQQFHFTESKDMTSSVAYNGLLSGMIDSNYLWIGYNGGKGFSRYSYSDQSFEHFHPHLDTMNGDGLTVTEITADPAGNIWLGTYGAGLFKYDFNRNAFTHFQQEQGLKSNFINSISPDGLGNLWISTADGMNYYNSGTNSISQVDIDIIFKSVDVIPNGVRGMNGKLYFFCYDGLVEIDPARYQQDQTFPKVVISNFKIFDEDMALTGVNPVINLSHRQNFFSFEYSALKTNPDVPIQYAYLLEGFDKDWNRVGNQNIAGYTNVPGGHYQFMIKATNRNGKWSPVLLKIPVNIQPPFWRMWWFLVLCTGCIAGVIYAVYQYRIRQLRRIYTLKSKISRDLHDDVGASLSSIHIYSTVAEKAMQDNPQKAGKIVEQIKQNSRQVMEQMSDIIWAMNSEQRDGESLVGRIKNYGYDLLSQKNIDCVYKIDPLAEKKLLNTEARKNVLLIVKEALNNIAKYSEATQAEIAITLDHSCLDIQIRDNGKGFDPSTVQEGNGLHNMKLRADTLGGTFVLQSVFGGGTSIHSRIPVANISDK